MRARIVSGALTAALVAGLLVATSPGASADVGDVTPFELPNGAPSPGPIISLANGDLMIAPESGTALTSVTTDGVATVRPLPGTYVKNAIFSGLAQAPDGRVWVSERFSDSLASVDPKGADFKQIVLPKSSDPGPMAIDASGNAWFVAPLTVRFGRVTPAGAVSIFSSGNLSAPFDIAAGPNGLVMARTGGSAPGLARVGADGTLTPIALPAGGGADSVAVASDGTMWAASLNGDKVYRVGSDGAATVVTLAKQSNPTSVAAAPDGSAWFVEVGRKKVGRLSAGGGLTEFDVPGSPRHLTVGADGNIWVTAGTPNPRVLRVLSGIAPSSTASPAVSSPAGSTNGTGTVLTATNGSWAFKPTTFAQQWQRCTGNDPATCTDIAGANKPAYTVTDTDLGTFVRATITATNLNGAGKPASSNLLQLAAKPAAPVQPTTPTPVAGGATVTLTPGVTATLGGPTSVKRKAKRTYRVTIKAPQPRGSVRLSLLNGAGTEVYVIADAAGVKGTKKTAYASKTARIPRSVAKGRYTLRAVYTPTPAQAPTYPIATLTKPLTLK